MRPTGERLPRAAGAARLSAALLAAGLVVVILAALALLVGAVGADAPAAVGPDRLLATWAAR